MNYLEPNLKNIEDYNGKGSLEHQVLFYKTLSFIFGIMSILFYLQLT